MIKLSILIPSYNYKKGLKLILSDFCSCNKSELNLIEIIVGDDSDRNLLSPEEVNIYKKYIPNFYYLFNINNLYINNWNNLISIAKGDYYWLFHHDEKLNNPNKSLKKIINTLNKKYEIIILPVYKIKTIKFRNIKFNFIERHSPYKEFIKYFIRNNIYLLYINIIGPPTALIISKNRKYFYENDLTWFVDVLYYYRVFERSEISKIKFFLEKDVFISSNQNFKNSITKKNKKNLNKFNKLKNNEEKKIKLKTSKDIRKLNLFILWTLFKIYRILHIKIKI